MTVTKCGNYDICEQYALYGKCEHQGNNPYNLSSFCDVYQKQVINILANIDEKLSRLLEK